MNIDAIKAASAKHPRPHDLSVSYGTAGFRARADLLDSTVFRCGVLAAMKATKHACAIGLMVTASHNPEHDNGVKLVERTGEMLDPAWEVIATTLVSAPTDDDLVTEIHTIASSEAIDLSTGPPSGTQVLIGADTRPSSARLVAAAKAGVEALGVRAVDLGSCTTPVLHYETRTAGDDNATAYFSRLEAGFRRLWDIGASKGSVSPAVTSGIVDCANGVGGVSAAALQPRLQRLGVRLSVVNGAPPQSRRTSLAAGDQGLNCECGSDYVQRRRMLPLHWPNPVPAGALCGSVDGDADRLVCFLRGAPGGDGPDGVVVLDGDYIAVLLAVYLKELLGRAGLKQKLSLGVVQTAYANGAATRYLQAELQVPVRLARTGVKHLHAAAKEFDVGVYFEPNGHGSIVFSSSCDQALAEHADCAAIDEIRAVEQVVNPAIGDAFSTLLLLLAVLRLQRLSVPAWRAIYQPSASRLATLLVEDRHVIATEHMDTRVAAPAGLQEAIDRAVAEVTAGRAFVRPSGTEDVVRVYAEAATVAECDSLCLAVLKLVHEHAAGLGDPPCGLG